MEPHSTHAPAPYTSKDLLAGSFGWMAAGLIISGTTSVLVAMSPLTDIIMSTNGLFLVLLMMELGMVWYLSSRINTMSADTARGIFIGYSILSGVTLSVIFFAFQLSSIISIFGGTAAMFFALSVFGARTSLNLIKIGNMAYFGLIGLIIAMIINVFIGGEVLDLILSWIGVIIFAVITAYDVQKIKAIPYDMPHSGKSHVVIIGALHLYLDFVNLFLKLLTIFGRRR